MGIGAKIKEALHADKEPSHNSPNAHHTPGAYPEETVPRTHDQTSTHGTQGLNTSSVPKSGNSGEYTYSPSTGTTGSTGLGHKTHHNSSSTGTTGSGYSAGTKEGSHGPHNTKAGNMLDPRIDSDRDNRAAPGATGVGHNSHSTGASGVAGTPGNYSSGTSEGLHGPHGSRVGNTLDPRVDSDRDNRAAPGHSNLGTTGTSSSHNKLTRDTKDPYWGDAQGSRVDEPGTHTGAHDRLGNSLDPRQVNEEYNRTGGKNDYDPYRHDSTGATSSLPHRPIESKVTPRDRKIQEYDAPTASSDYQGHGNRGAGVGTGLAGGAAAGFGAAKLADRHHEQDLRENNPSHGSHHHSGSRGNDAYDSIGSRERTSGAGLGMNDPHAVNTATQPGTGVGTSMLDPYGTGSGHAVSGSHAPGHEHNRNTTTGHREGEHGPHNSRIANALDPRVDSDRDGSKRAGATGSTGTTGTGYQTREGDNLHRDRHLGEAGVLGAGAAAYGAHEHHKHSPGAEYNRANPSSHTEGAYTRPHEGAGYGTSGIPEGSHGPHTSRVQNALDPRVDSDRDNREAPGSSGIHGGSSYGNSNDYGRTEGSHLRLRDSGDRSHNTTGLGGIGGTHDSGYGHENVGQGSSEYGPGHGGLGGGASSGTGPDHFGPSHQGAKVFHKCHNCGADNDISKHFSKDAVYRLG